MLGTVQVKTPAASRSPPRSGVTDPLCKVKFAGQVDGHHHVGLCAVRRVRDRQLVGDVLPASADSLGVAVTLSPS